MSASQDNNELTREQEELLLARHNRIKSERRSLLNTFILLSGGAIVLSISLLDKIAPNKIAVWIIILSWMIFPLVIIFSLLILFSMTRKSMKFQKQLEIIFLVENIVPGVLRSIIHDYNLEVGVLILFFLGVLSLGIFSMINLMSTFIIWFKV